MTKLNRVVAVHYAKGAQKALDELEALTTDFDYHKVGLFYAIKAELLQELGLDDQQTALQKAITLTSNELVKRHLKRKLDA